MGKSSKIRAVLLGGTLAGSGIVLFPAAVDIRQELDLVIRF
jgi:hypothetical protein